MKTRLISILIVLAALGLLLSACGAQATPVFAEGDEKNKVQDTVAPILNDILTGIQNNDFATFSKDFDDTMKKSLSQTDFTKIVQTVTGYGQIQTRKLVNIEKINQYYRVNYQLTYPNNRTVVMSIVIPQQGTATVSGLWFK